ncbi:Arm DNA-binding domain-containing protein [Roseovarius sp.]|uniref:Arm DNA-binding domain-containing protein n=1 Tax=Roseovarius sp. TaxID=1486281 RepID=UPI003B5BAC58
MPVALQTPDGGSQWIVRFQFLGRQRGMGFGSYTSISLAEARKQAELAGQQALREVDPINQRQLNRQQSNTTYGRLGHIALEANWMA